MKWVSVHAFYHGDLDVLLLDGVLPLVEHLRRRGLTDASFFLRYWDGGPHLRLRLRAGSAAGHVEALALRWLRRYLSAHPAQEVPSLDRYAEAAAAFATAEGMDEFLPEPLPNNTVLPFPYRPEIARYGDGASLAAVEQHFAESSRIALGLIAAGTDRDQRHTVAVSAILLTWTAFTPVGCAPRPPAMASAGRTAPSLYGTRAGEFEERYHAGRASLGVLASRTAQIADGTSTLPPSGSLTTWWRSITALRQRLAAAGNDPDRALRIADTCAHLLCNRLGLTITDESYVRYLAARAGER